MKFPSEFLGPMTRRFDIRSRTKTSENIYILQQNLQFIESEFVKNDNKDKTVNPNGRIRKMWLLKIKLIM